MSDTPAIGMSLSIEIGRGRSIVFQSHIERDSDLPAINSLLDKITAAADRQQAKCAVEDLRHRYQLQKSALENLMLDFYKIEEREAKEEREWNADPRRHGQWKRSEKEETHRSQMQSALRRTDEETKELKRLLDEAEQAAI